MSTYLDLVNNVLTRLREPTVSSVQDNSYSKLIGVYINDAKREVEDAYDWNSLTNTLSATTTDSVFNYVLTDWPRKQDPLGATSLRCAECLGLK